MKHSLDGLELENYNLKIIRNTPNARNREMNRRNVKTLRDR